MLHETKTTKTTETSARPLLAMKWFNARTGRRQTIYTQDGVDAHARAFLNISPDAVIAEIPDCNGDVAAIIMTVGPVYKTYVFDYDPDATWWTFGGLTSDAFVTDDDGQRVYGHYRLRRYSKLPKKYAEMLDAWLDGAYDDDEEVA
jgi:hypothetical protein